MADYIENVKRIKYLEALRDEYAEEAKNLRAQLAEQITEQGKYDAGEYIVRAQPNTRFNANKAAAVLSDEERAQVSVTTVDSKKFRALYPELVEDVSNDYGLKFVIVDKKEDEL